MSDCDKVDPAEVLERLAAVLDGKASPDLTLVNDAGVAIQRLRDALLPFALSHIRMPSGEQKERAFRLLGLDDDDRQRAAITALYPDETI